MLTTIVLLATLQSAPETPQDAGPAVVDNEIRPATAVEAPPRNGVRVYRPTDPAYRNLDLSPAKRAVPDAESRLLVFRDGVPVLDRGLRNENWTIETAGGRGPTQVEGVIEDAAVSEDGQFALLLTTTYRRPPRSKGAAATEERAPVGSSELTWIDATHPQGAWTKPLEGGRWAKQLVPLSVKQGVALATILKLDGPADLRIFGPDGVERIHLNEADGSVLAIEAAADGGFVAADLAYPDRAELPHRGVIVLDLLHGTRWAYTWRYGDNDEPVSWKLDDAGVLEVTSPAFVKRFDRNGKAVGVARRR